MDSAPGSGQCRVDLSLRPVSSSDGLPCTQWESGVLFSVKDSPMSEDLLSYTPLVRLDLDETLSAGYGFWGGVVGVRLV